MLVFNAGVVISRIRLNEYRKTFEPVAQYVMEVRRPGDLIYGDGGFAFHLGFDGALIDDFRLGYYSRRKARIMIMNGRYKDWLNQYEVGRPSGVPLHAGVASNQLCAEFHARPIYGLRV